MPKSDEVTTIFVVGFPDDFHEREFQNMFTFCRGFQASSLKRPSPAPITPTEEHEQVEEEAPNQQDSSSPISTETSNPTGADNMEDQAAPNSNQDGSDAEGTPHSPTQATTTALNGTANQSRKQIVQHITC